MHLKSGLIRGVVSLEGSSLVVFCYLSASGYGPLLFILIIIVIIIFIIYLALSLMSQVVTFCYPNCNVMYNIVKFGKMF